MTIRDTYSIQEVREIVENEELGYAVQHYIDSTQVEDSTLRDLISRAKTALDAVEEFLDQNDD